MNKEINKDIVDNVENSSVGAGVISRKEGGATRLVDFNDLRGGYAMGSAGFGGFQPAFNNVRPLFAGSLQGTAFAPGYVAAMRNA
jgi:hypothetical protein